MNLRDLINQLQSIEPDIVFPLGFCNPHSYRGFYDQLAFEPTKNVTVAEMLKDALSALGTTYEGYKGGEYRMGGSTIVWLAEYGSSCGALEITEDLIWFMREPPKAWL